MDTETMTFTFPVERVNIILTALAELPFRVAADVIADIRDQAQGQVQAAPEAPAAE